MSGAVIPAGALQGRALALLEVKTSGAHPLRDVIWELAIIQVAADGTVEARLHWLFEPPSALAPALLSLSGLHPLELQGQPRIAAEAAAIVAALRGRVLVGYNLRFALAFLRPAQLCTLRLARAVLPELAGEGFEALCRHFAIVRFFRHRAVPDAEASLALALQLCALAPADLLAGQLRSAARPPLLPGARFAELPQRPGVYYFLGDSGAHLYIGKSRNLRRRVLAHFHNDHRDRRSLHMVQQIRDVQVVPTAGELGALLLESAEIKRLQPLYNRRLRKQRELLTWALLTEPCGLRAELQQHRQLLPGASHVGLFRSRHHAHQWLQQQARERRLCLRVLGLEEGEGACFAYQLGRCAGACCGEEARQAHDARLLAGAERLQTQAWPWAGPVALVERDARHGLQHWHVLDQWRHLGSVERPELAAGLLATARQGFNLDTYHILLGHLRRHPNMEIVPL